MSDNSWLHSSPAFQALGYWLETIGGSWATSAADGLTATHWETLTRLLRLGYVEQRWKYRLTTPDGTAEFYLQVSGYDLGRPQSEWEGASAGSSFIKHHIAPAYPFLHSGKYAESIIGHEVRLTGDGAELAAMLTSPNVNNPPEAFRREFGELLDLVLLKSEEFIEAVKGTPLPVGVTHLASSVSITANGDGQTRSAGESATAAISESDSAETTSIKPRWDAEKLTLFYGDAAVRTLSGQAVNCKSVVGAFQELDWPTRIDDPLPDGRDSERLNNTVKTLNRGLLGIRFAAGGDGQSVTWQEANE